MTSSVWVRIRILSREVGYLFLVSVTLKSTRQPINTITFYLRDISTPLVGVAFKHIDQNVRTVNIQMLVDVISALQWLLWLGSALSRSLMFLSKGVHVFVLTKLPSSRFIFNLQLLHFDLIISSDSLIFLLYIWLPLIMSLGVDNWINHGILNNVQLHLNFPTFLLCCLDGVRLLWLTLFSLFHLCTLRLNELGEKSVDLTILGEFVNKPQSNSHRVKVFGKCFSSVKI